ncbi:MAG: aminopeptidase P family protein [Chloroflexi bacterium]|nr:aminopeptidase P family protein [Chloroflexota bacterium]
MSLHEKLTKIQRFLQEHGWRGWLLYDFRDINPIARRVAPLPSNAILSRRWAFWIPARGEPAWLVHAIERGGFSGRPERIETYSSWQSFERALRALTNGVGPIACEYSPHCGIPYVSYVDAGTAEQLRAMGYELHSSADLVQLVHATWSPTQLETHRHAVTVCMETKDAAFNYIEARLQEGVFTTELDVQQFIHDRLVAAGLDPDHPPIVAVNEHAGDPHYAPGPDRHSPILPGDLILIDLWGRVAHDPNAVFADMTWMGYAGPEPPPRMNEVLQVVALARDAAITLVQDRIASGDPIHGWEVDDAARKVIEKAGYGQYFIHRTGHSIDTEIHGSGVNIDNLETRDDRQLIPHIGFTIEPGVYLSEFGVRLEINMFVHEARAEVTTLPLQYEFVTMDVI